MTCVTNGDVDSGEAGNESGWGGDASVCSQPESDEKTVVFLPEG